MKTDEEMIEATREKLLEFAKEMDRDVHLHLVWMLNEIENQSRFNDTLDIRKTNRWIGFVHGTLVALTDCTVDELRGICK